MLACFYPFRGKLHSIHVAYVERTLWVCGSSAKEHLWRCLVLPSAKAGNIKDTSLVLLVVDVADAEGRMALPPVPTKQVRLGKMTASLVDATCGGRRRLVAEDVLPG